MNESEPETVNPSAKPPPPPKSRRKRQTVLESAATGPDEEWMLTYMDTVTLLVTLFVMILSFANFDKAKFDEFTHGMSLAKYGAGILMGTIGTRDFSGDVKIAEPLPMTAPVSSGPEAASQTEDRPESELLATLQEKIAQQGYEHCRRIGGKNQSAGANPQYGD